MTHQNAGEELRKLRIAEWASQREIARVAHMTPQRLNDIEHERGAQPTTEEVARISEALGFRRILRLSMRRDEQ